MMRSSFILIVVLFLTSTLLGIAGERKQPKTRQLTPATIVKVLTHLVDEHGKHSEAPSLYERDSYQAWLRANPEKISTIRFDIQWKAKAHRPQGYVIRVEMRGSKMPLNKMATFEQKVSQPKFLTKWSRVELTPEQYKEFGEPTAWRVSVWDGPKMVGVQESFLW